MDRILDMKMAVLGTWLLAGIFLDGWAHNHIHVENFFTPWHAVLYSGYLANLALCAWQFNRGRKRGGGWREAIPEGYLFVYLGIIIFGFSGIGDLIWHLIFGIEKSVEAGFSPPHLGIMIAAGLIVSRPFCAVWKRRRAPQGLMEWLPLLTSLTLTLSLMTFVFQYADPLVVVSASIKPLTFHDQALGAVSIILRTAFMMGWLLIAVKRWELPRGSVFAVLTINAVAMSVMRYKFFLLPALIPAAILVDLFVSVWKPSSDRRSQFYLFAFATPVIYFLAYFAAVWLKEGVSWSIPLWSGAILMSGIMSILLSLLILPPPYSEQ